MGEYEMWSGVEMGLGQAEGVLRGFSCNDRVSGSWILFSSVIGKHNGHRLLCLWALCSLVEEHCSIGGDSQAYQVKRNAWPQRDFPAGLEYMCV